MLTGALAGAQAGLSAIPKRFIEGLSGGNQIVDLAKRLP
jgi:ADP-ribosylglycohydrolase